MKKISVELRCCPTTEIEIEVPDDFDPELDDLTDEMETKVFEAVEDADYELDWSIQGAINVRT